jgi:Tol biopolymer transport system component
MGLNKRVTVGRATRVAHRGTRRWAGVLLGLTSTLSTFAQAPAGTTSILEIVDVESERRTVIHEEKRHFEAPNWTRDNQLIVNADGKLYRIPARGGTLTEIPLKFDAKVNNDHLLSADGKYLFISANGTADYRSSLIYRVPVGGGTPERVTPTGPSYLHGVSPDGNTLAYCAERPGGWDVYTIPVAGGEEKRLTDAMGLDDGPEYSPDGKWIYFNSHRTGRMHLYRMRPDGSGTEQLTNDEFDNWFGHPSPDGRSLVFISYLQDQQGKHPFGRDVKLRLMDLETRQIRDLTAVFFGGQGTINVPSWSPDSKRVAFVRYSVQN